MPLFDKTPPPPRRTRLDWIAYALCVAAIWIAALYEMLT